MKKLEFDESKVINALHVDLVKDGQTGIFANNILALKNNVENRNEKAFGKLTITKGEAPFSMHYGRSALFYPINAKDIFGAGYIDYLENYKLPKYKKDLSYKEFCNLIKNKDSDNKKYIFSASSTMTDWMDGEVYNAEVDFGDSYGPDHGKKGKVILIVEAPNDLLAKITANIWFDSIDGYHRSGCNYIGQGWSESKTWYNRRFFGEMKHADVKTAISSIKCYNTKSAYNLDGEVKTIKFGDIVEAAPFRRYFNISKNAYSFEKADIIYENLDNDKSLKERVEESFKKADLKVSPIYKFEAKMLYNDFDNTMNAIIESIKSFNALDKEFISKANKTLKSLIGKDYRFVRPEVQMADGKDTNKGLIFARSIHHNVFRDESDYYGYDDTKYEYIHPWYLANQNAKISDLRKTSLLKDFFIYYNDSEREKLEVFNTPVFTMDSFIIIPPHDPNRYHTIPEGKLKYKASDFFIWEELVDGITVVDKVALEKPFGKLLNNHLGICNEVFNGNNYVKVSVDIHNYNREDRSWSHYYSPEKSFNHANYSDFLNDMYKLGYHIVTSAHQKDDRGRYGLEKLDMYFEKNKKGIDYSDTLTRKYWLKNIKSENIGRMFD